MTIDRSKLNALIGNLIVGQFADPNLQQAVFNEIYANLDTRPEYADVITRTNTTEYTPTTSYNPATKKFTEDAIAAAIIAAVGTNFIQTGSVFPITPSSGQTFFNTLTGLFYVYANSTWNASASNVDLLNRTVGSTYYTYQTCGGF